MTIHRFYLPEVLVSNNTVSLTGEIAWQIAKVLRLKVGDIIGLFDNLQEEYRIELTSLDKKLVSGKVLSHNKNTNEPNVSIVLYQALLPREKFEDVLDKATEVGVNQFVPLETQRTLVKAKDIKEEKLQRWKKIVQEAAEQSERGKMPEVRQAMLFETAIKKATSEGKVLIAWEREEKVGLSNVIPNLIRDLDSRLRGNDKLFISLFIGPEGGFSEEEIAFAKENGVIPVSLGKRILRSETAGIVMPSLVLFEMRELES